MRMTCEDSKEVDEKVKALVIDRYADRFYALYDGEDLVLSQSTRRGR